MAHDTHTATKLADTKPGEYIRRKPDASRVYIRGAYDKGSKTYSLIDADDISREIFLKGSTVVYIGFTY